MVALWGLTSKTLFQRPRMRKGSWEIILCQTETHADWPQIEQTAPDESTKLGSSPFGG